MLYLFRNSSDNMCIFCSLSHITDKHLNVEESSKMNLLGNGTDRQFWDKVRESDSYEIFRNDASKFWNEYCESDLEALKYSEFRLFFTTGDRAVYEKAYFVRRKALCASAVMSLIYPDDERYINKLMDVIFAICDEYTWCLPAHQKQNEYNDNSRVDLFASETAFALAEIYTLLGDRLDSLIKSRIEVEVERRVFLSYESNDPYTNWEIWTNNWVAVCTGSIAGAYMLLAPDRARALIPRFERAMERFLSGYQDDGVCSEGCSYWRYGFGFFTVYADMIKTFTDGEIDHFASDKVKLISSFEQNMLLSGESCVSFSDSRSDTKYQLGLSHYLKDKYPDTNKVFDPKLAYLGDADGHFCLFWRSAAWFNEEYYKNPDPVSECVDFFAEQTQWYIKRGASYGFAVKGGHNAEFHNHNDVGSFIFASGGKHIITDPGPARYTRQYFNGDERYMIFEARSESHSVPIIGGKLQQHGNQYRAENFGLRGDILSMQMQSAYGIDELHLLERSFSFADNSVTLTDKIDYVGDGVVTERFILTDEPKVREGGFSVGDAFLRVSTYALYAVSTYTLRDGKVVYLLDLVLNKDTVKFVMTVECK